MLFTSALSSLGSSHSHYCSVLHFCPDESLAAVFVQLVAIICCSILWQYSLLLDCCTVLVITRKKFLIVHRPYMWFARVRAEARRSTIRSCVYQDSKCMTRYYASPGRLSPALLHRSMRPSSTSLSRRQHRSALLYLIARSRRQHQRC